MGHQSVGEGRVLAVGNGSWCDESSNHHEGEESDDGNHHGEGYTHAQVEDHDRSNRLVDSHRGGKGVGIESGNDHCEESHLESTRSEYESTGVTVDHTSASQRTLEPLNSWPSSFSTATFRSAAVSNSTKLI